MCNHVHLFSHQPPPNFDSTVQILTQTSFQMLTNENTKIIIFLSLFFGTKKFILYNRFFFEYS